MKSIILQPLCLISNQFDQNTLTKLNTELCTNILGVLQMQ